MVSSATATPELRQLLYFVAIAEELSFTAAARRVYVAQQALSAAVAQLERRVGVKLFNRTTRRVELTDAGQALLPHARATLDAADRGMEALEDVAAGRAGRLRIGLAGTAGFRLTPEVLRRFGALYPTVELDVRHFDFSDPRGGLLDETTDVAIVRTPFSGSELRVVELDAEPLYAVFGEGHPLADRAELEFDELLDEPWIHANTDPTWCRFWRVDHLRTRPIPSGPVCANYDDMFEAVRSLRGTGIVPESIATSRTWPGLRYVPVSGLPLSFVVVAWRKRDDREIVANFVEVATVLAERRRVTSGVMRLGA